MQMQLFDGLIHVNIVIECIFSSIYSYILAITLRYFFTIYRIAYYWN